MKFSNSSRPALVALALTGAGGLLSAGLALPADSPDRAQTAVAFVGVNVIPMDRERVLRDQTVVTRDGFIAEIGSRANVAIPQGARIVDGEGRYLIPGLADMHVHVWDEKELTLYVANGVTLVRNMWGEPLTLKMRQRVAAGNALGPTIVTAGPILDGKPKIWATSVEVTRPDDARRVVAEQKAAGYDFIKVYTRLSPEVFEAIAAAARAEQIPFTGHVPTAVALERAIESGMASDEHLYGFDEATVSDGLVLDSDEAKFKIAKRVANGELSFEEVFSSKKLQSIAELSAKHGFWNTPTLVHLITPWLARDEAATQFARPEMRYVAPRVKFFWRPENSFSVRNRSDEELKEFHGFFGVALQRVAALNKAGARLLAGTDAPNRFVLHGYSLLDEVAMFVRAGLTPYQALATATRNPAEFLGSAGRFGTVTRGARADLVLLEGNPLTDIRSIKRQAGVMLRGRWLERAELQTALDGIARYYAEGPDWFEGRGTLAVSNERAVALRAEYVDVFGDEQSGAERLALVSGSDGAMAIVSQSASREFGGNRIEGAFRLEMDADGLLRRYEYTSRDTVTGRETKIALSRHAGAYKLRKDGSDVQSVAVKDGAIALSGSFGDWFVVKKYVSDMVIGATREIEVWAMTTPDDAQLRKQAWTITRRLDSVNAALGVDRSFDIKIKSDEESRSLRVFFDDQDGWPSGTERDTSFGTHRRFKRG